MTTPRKRLRLWVACSAGLLLLAALPHAAAGQEQGLVAPSDQGTHFFRHLLSMAKLKPVTSIEKLLALDPQETVIIAFGDLRCLDEMTLKGKPLKTFADKGGAVLVASNRPQRFRLADFDIHITGQPAMAAIPVNELEGPDVTLRSPGGQLVSVSREQWLKHKATLYARHQEVLRVEWPTRLVSHLSRELWMKRRSEPYLGHSDCILLKHHIGSPHPLFANCDQGIATNNPSFILLRPDCPLEALCCFAPFPEPGALDFNDRNPPDQAFAVGSMHDPKSSKRILFLSNHYVFVNGMVLPHRSEVNGKTIQHKNDNLTFAVNTVSWLTNNKKRKYAFFVVDGDIVTNFDVPIGELPELTTRMVNNLLRDLEEQNFFNELVLGSEPHLSQAMRARIQRIVLALALVGLVVYGLRRYLLARHRLDPAVPLVEAKLAQTVAGYVPPVLFRGRVRQHANDFRETARELARACFGKHAEPPIVCGRPRNVRALQRAVDQLWTLAHGDQNQSVTVDALGALVQQADIVMNALANGTLRFGNPAIRPNA